MILPLSLIMLIKEFVEPILILEPNPLAMSSEDFE